VNEDLRLGVNLLDETYRPYVYGDNAGGLDAKCGVPGFVKFHLLRGPDRGDHVLYSSHTTWRGREDFEAWTRSEAFRKAHSQAGSSKPLYLDHPQFEGFEILQTIGPADDGGERR
jgi:heme-degrading monooxygenase HmoA